jgi:hypothetical protein
LLNSFDNTIVYGGAPLIQRIHGGAVCNTISMSDTTHFVKGALVLVNGRDIPSLPNEQEDGNHVPYLAQTGAHTTQTATAAQTEHLWQDNESQGR